MQSKLERKVDCGLVRRAERERGNPELNHGQTPASSHQRPYLQNRDVSIYHRGLGNGDIWPFGFTLNKKLVMDSLTFLFSQSLNLWPCPPPLIMTAPNAPGELA